MRLFAASLAEMWSSTYRRTPLSSDEAAAERLLAELGVDPEAPASQRTLELVLTAAAGPATERELAGEAAAVTAFLAALEPKRAPQHRHRRPRRIPVLAVGVAFAAVLALCGTAEAGALPDPLQQLAHQTIGAPAPAPSPAMRDQPTNGQGTPGSGGSVGHPTPTPNSPGVSGRPTSPGASPSPTHTDNGNGTDNGQGSSTNNGNGNGGDTSTPSTPDTTSPTTDSSSPTPTSTGSGNGNGTGNGNGKGNGKGNGSGHGNGNG